MLRGELQHNRSFCIFFKILSLMVFAFLIPKFFIHNLPKQTNNSKVFQFGIETINQSSLDTLCPADSKIGLLVNDTSYTQDGKHAIDFLMDKGFSLSSIFFTNATDMNYETIPCISWVSKDEKALENIDLFLVDIFDYQNNETQILLELLSFALLHNKKIIVLDRPNLCGNIVQGPIQRFNLNKEKCQLPCFHGMSVGELALYCNTYILPRPARLHIITMKAYKRSKHFFNAKFDIAKLLDIPCLKLKKTNCKKEQQLQSFFSKALTVFLYRPIPQLID